MRKLRKLLIDPMSAFLHALDFHRQNSGNADEYSFSRAKEGNREGIALEFSRLDPDRVRMSFFIETERRKAPYAGWRYLETAEKIEKVIEEFKDIIVTRALPYFEQEAQKVKFESDSEMSKEVFGTFKIQARDLRQLLKLGEAEDMESVRGLQEHLQHNYELLKSDRAYFRKTVIAAASLLLEILQTSLEARVEPDEEMSSPRIIFVKKGEEIPAYPLRWIIDYLNDIDNNPNGLVASFVQMQMLKKRP